MGGHLLFFHLDNIELTDTYRQRGQPRARDNPQGEQRSLEHS